MGLYPVAMCYNARQDNIMQYSTVQHNTIIHITQSNIHHSRQPCICKITIIIIIIIIKNTLYTISPQKRVELKSR